jgi:pimeloyl-ACP methyl ester carboxylesterase
VGAEAHHDIRKPLNLKPLLIAAVSAAGLYLVFLCGLFFKQAAFIYPGTQIAVAPTPPAPPGAMQLRIATPHASVDALFLPAASAAERQPVVIFAHGNGEVIDYWVSELHGFQERGIGVLLVEYPGYGRSTGSPSENSIRATMDEAYDRIAADPQVDRTRIFGFGQSLGGGAICLLARDRPLRALILQSTFTSLDTFTTRYWAPSFLLRDHFDNLATVQHFPKPILVIHGRQDPVIPWQQGQRLAAASPYAKFKLYECGHVCWDSERLSFWQDATPFLLAAGILLRAQPVPADVPGAPSVTTTGFGQAK